MVMILVLGRLRQEDQESVVILSYTASLGYMTSSLHTQTSPPSTVPSFLHSAPERQGFAGRLKVGSKAVEGAEGEWQWPKD